MGNDENRGILKVYWEDIRDRVAKVEPDVVPIIDELSPDQSYPLYITYYPYGTLIGDTKHLFLPNTEGELHCLSDSSTAKDVQNDLVYGKDSSPLGMVLDKNVEVFIDLKSENITMPWLIYKPGTFFPFGRILNIKNNRIYAPNGILTATAGARSVFMLPNIGCRTHHANLQRDFNIKSPAPQSLYEHWHLFKELINSKAVVSDWKACILYFSEKWVTQLHNDNAWLRFKTYLHELAWQDCAYHRNRFYYDITFAVIQNKRNLRPNPYLADTARHLFTIALGDAISYTPAENSDALPMDILQQAFVESYGLKKYYPSIMQPTKFNFEKDQHPVYYSLQHPCNDIFSPKSRKVSSTLFDIHELEHIMRIFIDELGKEGSMCSDTTLNQIIHTIEFNYYHNKPDRHRIVQSSLKIPEHDTRFETINEQYKLSGAEFSADAKFVRGCVSLSVKR